MIKINPETMGLPPRIDLKAPDTHIVAVFLSQGFITATYVYGKCASTITTYYETVCLQ